LREPVSAAEGRDFFVLASLASAAEGHAFFALASLAAFFALASLACARLARLVLATKLSFFCV
jgi:hypothetical protein